MVSFFKVKGVQFSRPNKEKNTVNHIDLNENYHTALKGWYRAYKLAAGPAASADPRAIANQIKMQLIGEARRYSTSFVVADLETAMILVDIEDREQAAKLAINKIAFDPLLVERGNEHLAAYLQILLYRPASNAECAVIKQFLWLVKRHLVGKPASHHIMPVIVGGQGSGKTETLKRLIRGSGLPEDLILATSFSYLEDERNTPALSKHFIVFLDEMARASRADVNNLKRLITESTLTYRPMRTNEERKLKNNVTLIGASNQSIVELIKDYTGMRRYYELVTADASKYTLAEKNARWKGLDSIDFAAIWSSINEGANGCQAFVESYEAINGVQVEQLSASNVFVDFLTERSYIPYMEGAKINYKLVDMIMDYRKFLQDMGSYADSGLDLKGLRRKLKDNGFEIGFSNNKPVTYMQAVSSKASKLVSKGALEVNNVAST